MKCIAGVPLTSWIELVGGVEVLERVKESDVSHPNILVSTSGSILTIEVSRREQRNALTSDIYRSLARELAGVRENSSISVVLIRGQDDLFICDDFNDFLAKRSEYLDARGHFLRILASFEKPLVAAVAGDALGIGTSMLLHCDLVYAADNARFQFPFVNLALCPEAGCSRLLPRFAGRRQASELLLLGESFGPEKAQEAGIVNSIFPAGELMGKATTIAGKLAAQPQQAVAITKHLMRLSDSEEHDALLAMRLEALHLAERATTSSASERVAAYLIEQAGLWPLEGQSARCGPSLDVEYN